MIKYLLILSFIFFYYDFKNKNKNKKKLINKSNLNSIIIIPIYNNKDIEVNSETSNSETSISKNTDTSMFKYILSDNINDNHLYKYKINFMFSNLIFIILIYIIIKKYYAEFNNMNMLRI